MNKPKRQRKLKKDTVTVSEDRISNLPDVLLTCMLSFLSTKDSVRSSILSRRWKSVWASVPILSLSDFDFPPKGDDLTARNRKKAGFLTFVYRYMMQTNLSSVRKFCVRGSERYDMPLMESWISIAKEHAIQELEIDIHMFQQPHYDIDNMLVDDDSSLKVFFYFHHLGHLNGMSHTRKLSLNSDDYHDRSLLESWLYVGKEWNVEDLELVLNCFEYQHFEFPQIVFTYDMLVVLKLEGYHMVLNLPTTSFCFPKLKALYLWGIRYKDDDSASYIIKYGCPVLEDLDIIRFEDDNLGSFSITSQSLKCLKVCYKPEEQAYSPTDTVIDLPALRYLNIKDEVTENYRVTDLSSLVEVKLDLKNETAASAFLMELYTVEKLSLCDDTMLLRSLLSKSSKAIIALEKADTLDLPTFHHLTSLEIGTTGNSFCQRLVSWKLILKFLKRSLELENLIFQRILFGSGEELGSVPEQDLLSCLVSKLHTIEIESFSCKEDEVDIAHYFLKNSRVLKKLRVKPQGQCSKEVLEETILALPKGSGACQIEIDC